MPSTKGTVDAVDMAPHTGLRCGARTMIRSTARPLLPDRFMRVWLCRRFGLSAVFGTADVIDRGHRQAMAGSGPRVVGTWSGVCR